MVNTNMSNTRPIFPPVSFDFAALLQTAFHCQQVGIPVEDDADPDESHPASESANAQAPATDPCRPLSPPKPMGGDDPEHSPRAPLLSDILPNTPDCRSRSPVEDSSSDNPSAAESAPPDPLPNPSNPRKRGKNRRTNRKRAKKRREKVEKEGHVTNTRTVLEHVQLCEPLNLAIDYAKMPVSLSGYVGIRSSESKKVLRNTNSLNDLLAMGFEVVEWDGREARPIIDANGRVCGVLAGRPNDKTYDLSVDRACRFLQAESAPECFRPEESRHRRGPFAAVAFGISFGGGQKSAQRLVTGSHTGLVERVLSNRHISRLASYADGAFRTWSPRLYAYYRSTLLKASSHTRQRINFKGSCFAAMSVNMGGKVCCFKHRDCVNLAFGWCAITAMGNFDPKKGGHFVLWDLKLIIEFPPGSTILIPSAVFSHSNTSIGTEETRFSITQYTAGALFRWVENGFKTDKELQAQDPAHYSHMSDLKASRFEHGIRMYCTLDELCKVV
ncbi:hypothetical protein CVT24_006747 [Panaeolus cyanescens]|uniref:Uncharacterized protein n=1 Tax=Panaeolus cyanescens TaxID=181874 RepID=A0A409V9E1_9AGAR|nr:hypothetical protein CVT24_006747 [Panaeolus cyanescens]